MTGSLGRYVVGFKKKKCLLVILVISRFYHKLATRVSIIGREFDPFHVIVGVQSSTLSSYLFVLKLDKISRHLHAEMAFCMLFANDIVLVDENREKRIFTVERT